MLQGCNQCDEDIWVLEIPVSPAHLVHPAQSHTLNVTQPKGQRIIKYNIECIFYTNQSNISPYSRIYADKLPRNRLIMY